MNNSCGNFVKWYAGKFSSVLAVLMILLVTGMEGTSLKPAFSSENEQAAPGGPPDGRSFPEAVLMLGSEGDSAYVIEKASRTLYHFNMETHELGMAKRYPLETDSMENVKEGIYFRKDETLSGLFSGRGLLMEKASVNVSGEDRAARFLFQCMRDGAEPQTADSQENIPVIMFRESLEKIADSLYPKRTPFIVQDHLLLLSRDAYGKELHEITQFLENWKQSWEDRDIDRYMKYYSGLFTHGKMNIKRWQSHKRKIFSRSPASRVTLTPVHVLKIDPFVWMTLIQAYQSDSYNDVGIKRLLIRREGDGWKIVREEWERYDGRI